MRAKWRDELQTALAIVATVVGAGFASGREIVRFFSAFGAWSWAGCVLAAAFLAAFCIWAARASQKWQAYDLGSLCRAAIGGVFGQAAAWLNGVLITITAGAMIAAMGELAALSLPVRPAYEIGVLFALSAGFLLSRRGLSAIAGAGMWLLPTCALLYLLLLRVPAPMPAKPMGGAWRTFPLAFAYAALNAALGCGVLCEVGRERDKASVYRACAMAGGLLLLLLLGANAVLTRHLAAVGNAALPIVMIARALGAPGYWLCVAALSLAVMSTLIALIRTLARMLEPRLPSAAGSLLSVLLPCAAGLIGFQNLVGRLYPLLGAASTLLFLAMIARTLPVRTPLGRKGLARALHQDHAKKEAGSSDHGQSPSKI